MRIYRYTGAGTNILTRIIRKGERVEVKSRSFDNTKAKGWKLIGSTNDMRKNKIKKPELDIDWEDVTGCKAKLKRLRLKHWRKLKSYCRDHGVKRLSRHSEAINTRVRIQSVSLIMDFAFDCGWTGEQDKIDTEGLKGVFKKITKKETKTKNDKDGREDKDKKERSKPRGKEKAVHRTVDDNGPKEDRRSSEKRKSPSKKPSKKS